ncbi:MAG: phosphoribulokinase [Thiotrichales bacterium]|nr:phosphoribulokinase [Thiotrichales bacterium]
MSVEHPIVSVTGSSGAGTSFVKRAVEAIFKREGLNAAIIEGDSFHKYSRMEMRAKVAESKANGGPVLTHFSEYANEFQLLEALFAEYKKSATGKRRYYIHSDEEAAEHNARLGTHLSTGEFTPWEDLPADTDILFYEGLHGMVKRMDHGPEEGKYNVAQHVDLGIGVAPVVNIEWMQKIYRDTSERPYTVQQVRDTIMERMDDYIEYILPQFHRTHINFQRIPLVDTSDPFSTQTEIAPMGPSPENSLVITHVRHKDIEDLSLIVDKIEGAWLQNETTMICSGTKMVEAMDLIMTPIIQNLIAKKRAAMARLAAQ